ncbi:MAG TPA: branched-chain amino acid ABC transporter permease, partial [Archangium sp.]
IDQLRKPIFGLLLVVMMLTRPQGLFGTHEVWDFFDKKKKRAAT